MGWIHYFRIVCLAVAVEKPFHSGIAALFLLLTVSETHTKQLLSPGNRSTEPSVMMGRRSGSSVRIYETIDYEKSENGGIKRKAFSTVMLGQVIFKKYQAAVWRLQY